jgi:hypothetical protein
MTLIKSKFYLNASVLALILTYKQRIGNGAYSWSKLQSNNNINAMEAITTQILGFMCTNKKYREFCLQCNIKFQIFALPCYF